MDSQSAVGESRTVHRALDVLEWLARRDSPVPLAEVAEAMDAPKATVHRLLATLQSRGYVAQKPDSGNYASGIRCFELGSLWAQKLDVRVIAGPHLRHLNEETGETVHLAVYERGDVVYIDKLESRHPIVAQSHVGYRAPASCVATGRALLAFMPAAEIDRVLAAPLDRHTSRTLTDPEELRALLATVRRTGYALNLGSYREGVCGVAAPIRDHTGAVVASIGCCVPQPRFDAAFEVLRDGSVAAAAAISEALGWFAPPPLPSRGASGAAHELQSGTPDRS